MKFRKPTEKDFNSDGDSTLCWRKGIFEIWYDLNYGRYDFRIIFCVPMQTNFFLKRIISRLKRSIK